ncbi:MULTISPECIES: hypothetical protein [unclassified Pseudomonas]|jgi:hypothetical protein|uniref:DUF6916 family protein n=1 Tax=unclassified Pseudomonas TaxID=196821 RepID=UPI0020040CCA|nr:MULTISPECIES: hypothetical protein [unclassified Pseudomonas]MCK6191123.1 hypothetical protein [Pseudomonas sp. EYE_354]WLH68662.1 hypothetical protein PSH59_00675 [Pseudomonas sp. FP2309]
MLNLITPEHFRPLLGHNSVLYLPDGSALPIQVQSVREAPRATLPGSARGAFSVLLNSLGPTDFVDGLCHLPLPETNLDPVFVSREPAMGRDAERGYFCIVFN